MISRMPDVRRQKTSGADRPTLARNNTDQIKRKREELVAGRQAMRPEGGGLPEHARPAVPCDREWIG